MRESTGEELEEPEATAIEVHAARPIGFIRWPRSCSAGTRNGRSSGLSLFVGQAFLYNAVFFTYALVLTTFYKVSLESVGYYLIAFAVGNFLGPLILGRLFDVIGRRVMIAGTYLGSGAMLAVTAYLFDRGSSTRDHADHRLGGDLLLRIGGRQLGLPDRQRDLPDGDPGARRSPSSTPWAPVSAGSSGPCCSAT